MHVTEYRKIDFPQKFAIYSNKPPTLGSNCFRHAEKSMLIAIMTLEYWRKNNNTITSILFNSKFRAPEHLRSKHDVLDTHLGGLEI